MAPNTLALVLAALVATACTTAQAANPSLTQAEVPRGCALGVPGALVVAEDTPEGVALSTEALRIKLRERADAMNAATCK